MVKECLLKFIRAKDRFMFTKGSDVMERWREYFAGLLRGGVDKEREI